MRNDKEELEHLMDRMPLGRFFEVLAEIASEKADHIAVTWQDHSLADDYTKLSAKLTTISNKYYAKRR